MSRMANLMATVPGLAIATGNVANAEELAQVSGGYEFENGLGVSLGYARDADVGSHVIGVRLTKAFEFSSRN